MIAGHSACAALSDSNATGLNRDSVVRCPIPGTVIKKSHFPLPKLPWRVYRSKYEVRSPMKNCPSCKSIQTERIHRTAFQRLLSKIGLHPFICNECGRRFYGRIPPASGHSNRARPRHP